MAATYRYILLKSIQYNFIILKDFYNCSNYWESRSFSKIFRLTITGHLWGPNLLTSLLYIFVVHPTFAYWFTAAKYISCENILEIYFDYSTWFSSNLKSDWSFVPFLATERQALRLPFLLFVRWIETILWYFSFIVHEDLLQKHGSLIYFNKHASCQVFEFDRI